MLGDEITEAQRSSKWKCGSKCAAVYCLTNLAKTSEVRRSSRFWTHVQDHFSVISWKWVIIIVPQDEADASIIDDHSTVRKSVPMAVVYQRWLTHRRQSVVEMAALGGARRVSPPRNKC